jgi:molecular chaperone Hsp33
VTVAGAPSAGEDAVLPFEVGPLDVRGRIVHLSTQLDCILSRHDYPEPVARLLAEALTLTALLGASLKIEGQFLLQTQTDGPVSMLVVEFRTPGDLRATATFDAGAVAQMVARDTLDAANLLGSGHLALTIDPGGTMNRYQGIVALDGQSLEEAAHSYFERSEQIPTRIRLAVAKTVTRGPRGAALHGWRSGGIVIQFLPNSGAATARRDLAPGDVPADAPDQGEAP